MPPEIPSGPKVEDAARAALLRATAPAPPPPKPGLKPRKTPLRTCVACREERPKRELVRVVRSTEGEVALDPTGKRNGRGAYLCPKLDCLKLAVKRKALERALGEAPSAESLAALEAELAKLASP